MSNSVSNFSIYNQAGELIRGNLKGCSELVKQLDAEWIAFYFKSKDNEVILGSRLIVKIIAGREERLFFFARYSIKEITSEIIINFYEHAIKEIKKLERPEYNVIGLLSRGDIKDIVVDRYNDFDIKPLIGSLLVNEKLELSISSIVVIARVVEELKPLLHLGFRFIISKYRSDADLLISEYVKNVYVDTPYTILYDIYKKYADALSKVKTKAELKKEILHNAIREYPNDICKLYKHKIEKLFECIEDRGALINVINCIDVKIDDEIKIDDEVAKKIIIKIIKIYKNDYDDIDDIINKSKLKKVEDFLSRLYETIKDENIKKDIQIFCLEHNININYIIKDIIKRIKENKDKKLLNMLSKTKNKALGDAIKKLDSEKAYNRNGSIIDDKILTTLIIFSIGMSVFAIGIYIGDYLISTSEQNSLNVANLTVESNNTTISPTFINTTESSSLNITNTVENK